MFWKAVKLPSQSREGRSNFQQKELKGEKETHRGWLVDTDPTGWTR